MSGWTSNDPSMRATKSTAQYAREQEMNERIMEQRKFKSIEEASKATGLSEEAIRNFKPVDQMTADELVRALKPCECDHLLTDHDVRGWCCRYQCLCKHYVERTWETGWPADLRR